MIKYINNKELIERLFIIFPFLLSDLTSSMYDLLIGLSTLLIFNSSAGLNF